MTEALDRSKILSLIEEGTIKDLLSDKDFSDKQLISMLNEYLSTHPETSFTERLRAALAGTSSEE